MSKIKRLKLSAFYLSASLTIILCLSLAEASIEKEWPVMKAGNSYLLTADTDDEMALYQIIFFSAEEQQAAAIKITFEPGSQDNIYQKIVINKTNMKQDLLSAGSVKLKIRNDWIEKNVPNGSSVKLADENGKVIAGNNIIFSRKGDVYSYYSASVPMNTFYIATSMKAAAKEENKTNETTAADDAQSTPSESTSTADKPEEEAKTETKTEEKTDSSSQPTAPAPSCTDSIKNQDETDVDCGGPCKRCETGKACGNDGDCEVLYCKQGVCTQPTCEDGAKNQQESDVDCGGFCAKCADSRSCKSNEDCQSRYCSAGTCERLPEEKKESSIPNLSLKSVLDFKLDLSEKTKRDLKNYSFAALGLIIIIAITLFVVRKGKSRGRDPSMQDLMKLYDEVKRI